MRVPPLTLAIDTSTLHSGIALAGEWIHEIQRFGPPLRAGERLAPAIAEVLQRQELEPRDLDLLVLANGPGSFTGLRIGLSTAKGLAFGLDLPLAAVSTLDVLAWQCPVRSGRVYPVMEARRGEVYTAAYERRGPALTREGDFLRRGHAEFLADLPAGAMVCGPAVEQLREAAMRLESHVELADPPDNQLSLPWLIRLGRERFDRQDSEDVANLEPFYLQSFTPTRGRSRL